jgi:hypothetical protein
MHTPALSNIRLCRAGHLSQFITPDSSRANHNPRMHHEFFAAGQIAKSGATHPI